MKKFTVLSFFLLAVISMNAQIRFGIKAGSNLSNLYVSGNKQGINSEQYNAKFGYHFGGVMEYSFSKIFSIQPEFMYLNHGTNLKKDNSFGMKNGHITLNTLQLPVNLKATFDWSKNRIFVYAGPYLSYNIYGKAEGKINGENQDIELFSDDYGIRRLDYGFGIGAGVEFNKFTITISNQRGHADINRVKGSKMKTGNISVSLGYFF